MLLLDEERQYRQPATKQSKSNRVREIITKIIMVRHHLKKKKVDATSNKQLRQQSSSSKRNHQRRDHDDIEKKKREDEEDLNRFAGSSEEEEEEEDDDGRGDNGDNNKEEDGSENDNHNVDSDDSDNDYDDVYNNPSKTISERAVAPKKSNIRSTKKASNESDDDDDDEVEDDESSEEDEYADKANYERSISKSEGMSRGLAGAMSRILAVGKLSSSSSSNTIRDAKSLPTSSIPTSKPIILSKTTTPIQRLQRQIKNEERELLQKRKNRRADNLSAMRLPLAPTAGMSAEKLRKQKEKMKNVVKSTGATNNKKKKKKKKSIDDDDDDEDNDGKDDLYDSNALAMANEIESERTHRRIATRGVVALFNAISKHRADAEAKILEREEEKKRRAAAIDDMNGGGNVLKKRKKESEENNNSATTKHEFLDMIKKSSVTTKTVVGGSTTAKVVRSDDPAVPIKQQNGPTSTSSVGWNALKDDFMMNSKLKDWDKEISDDDE